ncbi:ABC transporter permease [Paenibacillus piscarius]|uniref:ABC transporter permease n=1 Tax=Paenibacillus piscarius TaxID=1089681 RepID=UPI001EE91690|nr:ABC transporter permease [Paenibacillus piscarius]
MNIQAGRKFTRILGAEWGKLVTLPAVWLILAGTFVAQWVLTAAYTSVALQEGAILSAGLASMRYLQAGFMMLGVTATASEYTGGQIRTTLTALPWRGLQLSVKHLALVMIAVPAAFLMAASGVLYASLMLRDTAVGLEPDLIAASLAGATGYLTFTALLGAAAGAIWRRTTPALVILLGYYFIVSPLAGAYLPDYLPDTAGYYMYAPPSADPHNALTRMQGTGISILWTLLFITAAILLYRKRDA